MLKISTDKYGDIFLTPCPLVSINHAPIKNKVGTIGGTYNITLNGTIVVPYSVRFAHRSKYIFEQQSKIRSFFAKDGQKIEIGFNDGANFVPALTMFPIVTSIDFQEGQYIDICNYTINLETPFITNASGSSIFPEAYIGSFSPKKYTDRTAYIDDRSTLDIDNVISKWGGIVEDFADSWSIEEDDSFFAGNDNWTPSTHPVYDTSSDISVPKSYRLTRNMSATGRTFYASGVNGHIRHEAVDQAVKFIKKTLLCENLSNETGKVYFDTKGDEKYLLYPGFRIDDSKTGENNIFSSGVLNIPNFYGGYNHIRSLNYDKNNGSCSVTDSWILTSGTPALENYTISIDNTNDNPRKTVKINGNIKGLANLAASGYQVGAGAVTYNNSPTPYSGALNKYFQISNNGQFGINSTIFKRAKSLASGVYLNSQPLNISLATNELTGEITYNIDFDDRPLNYFSGVLYENININDTYPGDIYALIPVIGRSAGPVIQYIRSRTEYKRDATIELLLDYTDIKYPISFDRDTLKNNNDPAYRNMTVLNKPSLNDPIRTQLRNLVLELSPSGDPNVTKFYLNPPTETWMPKEGRYTLNLNWSYEKNL